MELNANFDERATVHAGGLAWKASPMAGVERRMLDRIGDEVARATTIVKYDPGSHFSPHTHTGGEEFLVLDGVFQDEHGDFPVGSYIRNPPTSSHTPGSDPGCTIFVKLWQFDLADRQHVNINTETADYIASPDQAGVEILPLYADDREVVRMERWAPGSELSIGDPNGYELLVVKGGFSEAGEDFTVQSWLRLPKGGTSTVMAGPEGATVWIKAAHLKETPQPPVV